MGIVQQLSMAGEKKTIAVVALTIERFPNNLGSGRPSITQVRQWGGFEFDVDGSTKISYRI
jgi:hypothetical protein